MGSLWWRSNSFMSLQMQSAAMGFLPPSITTPLLISLCCPFSGLTLRLAVWGLVSHSPHSPHPHASWVPTMRRQKASCLHSYPADRWPCESSVDHMPGCGWNLRRSSSGSKLQTGGISSGSERFVIITSRLWRWYLVGVGGFGWMTRTG